MTESRVVSPHSHFGRCPESLLFSDATPHECTLYAALTTYDYRRSGECYPGRELLAERLQWTLRTLDRAFKGLEDRGAIERKRQGRGHPNLIILHADLAPVDESPDVASQPMSRQIVPDESPNREISPLIERDKNETKTLALTRKDELFEAIALVCGTDWKHLTSSARGALNRATSEIRAVGGVAEEVPRRAAEYRARMPEMALTPSALAKWWPSLNGDPSTVRGKHGPLLRAAARVMGGENR